MSTNRWIASLKGLINQVKTLNKNKIRYVGEDHLGNKYYEEDRPHSPRKQHRYYLRDDYKPDTHVADLFGVPPAWDAWLRYRRINPPTELEVKESEEYFSSNQAMAKQSDAQEEQKEPSRSNMPKFDKNKKRSFPKLPLDR